MTKSKRISKGNKLQKVTKVAKKEKTHKVDFISTTKSLIADYSTIFVLNINNLRTNLVSRIRDDFRDSKIIFGKKRLLIRALGDNELSKSIKGNECLLLTNRGYEEVTAQLSNYKSLEYVRTGSPCMQTVTVLAQTLYAFQSDIEPTLRLLGMPVELKNGKLMLLRDHRLCTKGDQVTNTMSRLLKFFQVQIAEFSAEVLAMWKDDEYTAYESQSSDTSLEANVEVKCEKLDDDKYYFICYPVDGDTAAMDAE